MRLRAMDELRRRAQAGVEVCTTHGPACPKYPDRGNPESVLDRIDLETVEMLRAHRQSRGETAPAHSGECKTRKLSDDELRQRREYAETVREARRKNRLPPLPPWAKVDMGAVEILRRMRLERHKQEVCEGYGNTVPEFEES